MFGSVVNDREGRPREGSIFLEQERFDTGVDSAWREGHHDIDIVGQPRLAISEHQLSNSTDGSIAARSRPILVVAVP